MKRKFKFVLLLQFSVLSLFAQTMITYEKHGMRDGDIVSLIKIDTISPGNDGENQTWDYSNISFFDESVTIKYEQEANLNSEKSFVCNINDERNSLYLNSNYKKMYVGFSTPTASLEFEEPIIEMAYPFVYNSKKEGVIKGKYSSVSGEVVDIDGSYSLVADAWGTLILPNKKILKNVLRVKFIQDYFQPHSGILYHVRVVRYLFYSENYRYPVLQIKDALIDCDCSCKSRDYEAYFYEKTINIDKDKKQKNLPNFTYEIVKNPFETELQVDYSIQSEAKIRMDLFDLKGKQIKVLLNEKKNEGVYSLVKKLDLPDAPYVLKIEVDGVIFSEKVIKR